MVLGAHKTINLPFFNSSWGFLLFFCDFPLFIILLVGPSRLRIWMTVIDLSGHVAAIAASRFRGTHRERDGERVGHTEKFMQNSHSRHYTLKEKHKQIVMLCLAAWPCGDADAMLEIIVKTKIAWKSCPNVSILGSQFAICTANNQQDLPITIIIINFCR